MRCALTAAVIAWSPLAADPALAQAAASRQIEISAGPLAAALDQLARQAAVSIGTEGALPALRVGPVRGTMTAKAALRRLLDGSGYVARRVGPNAFLIERGTTANPGVPQLVPQPVSDTPPPMSYGEPIVVTATKREQPLFDVPLAVAVVSFDPASVRDAQPGTASVARQVEGLALGGQGPGRNRMFLRGVADSPFTGSTQSTVAVVLDGARVTWSAPDPDLRLIDVSRVEVIKGPQGALYGTGALGGIYHIVSNRPDSGLATARFEAGPDAVGGGEFGRHGSAIVNLPIIRDQAALRFAVFAGRDPGWIDTGSRGDSNRLSVAGGRATLRWLAGGWTFDLAGQGQFLDSRDSQYAYAPGKRSRPDQIPEPHDNDFIHFAAEVTGPIGTMDLHLVSAVTSHDVSETFDASSGAESFGLMRPTRFVDARNYRVRDNEARLSGDWGSTSWIAGLAYVEARETVDRQLESADPLIATLSIEQARRKATDTALFGEATVPLGGALEATLGARLYHETLSDRAIDLGVPIAREERRTGVSPSASLSWRPGARGLLYLRYGSAIRQGGLDVPSPTPGKPSEGDELRTVELGFRRELPASGRLEASLYATDWKNLQSDILQANGLFAARNAGRARILGAEASLEAQLAAGWRISVGGAFQDARLVRNDLGIELDDRRLPVIPVYTLRARIEHGFAWPGANRTTIAAELHYGGPARLSFDPALDRSMGETLDARLGGRVALGRWSLSAQLDNLLGSRANQFAYGNPFRILTTRQYVPAAPTRASLSIGAAF